MELVRSGNLPSTLTILKSHNDRITNAELGSFYSLCHLRQGLKSRPCLRCHREFLSNGPRQSSVFSVRPREITKQQLQREITLKTCPTCGKDFEPIIPNHTYCQQACHKLARHCGGMKDVISRYEREVIDVMSLCQMQKKKISDLNKMLSSVRCYIERGDATVEGVKKFL